MENWHLTICMERYKMARGEQENRISFPWKRTSIEHKSYDFYMITSWIIALVVDLNVNMNMNGNEPVVNAP